MHKLKGKVQHYAWGGTEYIPQLLGEENPGHQPYAEYWMGAHTSSPSVVLFDETHHTTLDRLIKEDPHAWLGDKVTTRFGALPYLFKVLDVRDMLSIQVHPTKAEAEKGFARENEAGIPLSASNRNYKDDNHKPEVMVALSEFWLLHGFKEKNCWNKPCKMKVNFNRCCPYLKKGEKLPVSATAASTLFRQAIVHRSSCARRPLRRGRWMPGRFENECADRIGMRDEARDDWL